MCLLADLGRERFFAGRAMIDPVIERRITAVLEVTASDYVALERRREASMKCALQRFESLDALDQPDDSHLSAPRWRALPTSRQPSIWHWA